MTDADVSGLIEEFHVPRHVRRHCEAVARFALSLGEKLVAMGVKIDLALLRHAALLHDFVRVVDFRTFNPERFPDPVSALDMEVWKNLRAKYCGLHHAIAGAQILAERGFIDVAEIVRAHRYLQIVEGFDSWEKKLLYYADKRTRHDTIVSLKERLEDGRRRNAPGMVGSEKSLDLDEKVYALEREIMHSL